MSKKTETTCPTCGITFMRCNSNFNGGKNQYCSEDCYNARFPSSWVDEVIGIRKQKTRSGDVRVYLPDHHLSKDDGYVLEHLVVWEVKTGQSVPDGKTVHHLNGIRDDNRPENLSLF